MLAGRTSEGASGVAAHEQLLNGAVFGLSTLLLLLGLRSVLRSFGTNREVFEPAQGIVRTAITLVGPAVLLALTSSNTLDLERSRAADGAGSGVACGPGGFPTGVWSNLAIVLVAFACILLLAAVQHRLPVVRSAPTLVAKLVLAATALVTAWSAVVLPFLPEAAATSGLSEHLTLLVTSALTVAFVATVRMDR